MSFNLFKLITYFLLFYGVQTQAEIYQWLDSEGRMQFSDSPNGQYDRAGYPPQSSREASILDSDSGRSKNLEAIAKELKQDRLKREKLINKATKARAKKNKKQKQQLAAAKKKKLACKKARDKEDLAFRQRTQHQGLVKMRKALANYEKKRESRLKKCKG